MAITTEKEWREIVELRCEECRYGMKCPMLWHRNNAACLTIKEKKNDIYSEKETDGSPQST